MVLHDLFDWTNSGVGVAGLALTAGALWQATGAKRAAEEARHAVYRRNASDDVKRLEVLASSLFTAIEIEQYDLASYRSRDFIADCPNVREHHRARLGTGSGKLRVAFDLVCAISRELQAGRDKSILIQLAQRVVEDMGSLAGILSRNEEDGQ